MKPNILSAYQLIHNGILAFADMEQHGIRIDIEYVKKKEKKLARDIDILKEELNDTEIVRVWKKKLGSKFNIDSNPQLAKVLFQYLDYEPVKMTEKNNPSVDQEALESLNIPEVNLILKLRKTQKMKNTYIGNIRRETVDGFLHCVFNMHIALTYRSSSNNINFQNNPIRDPVMGKTIRRAFIPREGRMILEADYGGIEVKVGTCYHKDPVMFEYINDPSQDMHRDMSMECYILEQKEVTKDIRYCGKNQFVFPEFYGSYYAQCAKHLWDSISSMKLITTSGIPLKKHLKAEGIKSYVGFEKHIETVEEDFWGRRFKVYDKWKDKHYKKYLKKGYFDTLTGFRCQGLMSRNDAINYPVQGSAFHCLLWSLIKINKILKKKKFKTCIIGQIHDSIVLDVVPNELDDVLSILRKVMCEDIKKYWKWIIVPLDIEIEATEVDQSWSMKKVMEI